MTYLKQNVGGILKEDNVSIGIDLENISTTLNGLIITHLTPKTLTLLKQELNIPIYLTQDLLLLLQKTARFNFILLAKQDWQVLPYNIWTKVDCFKVQAFKSDDNLFSAMALLIRTKTDFVGYCGRFCLQGEHKKAVNKWKKAFLDTQVSQLIFEPLLLKANEKLTSTKDLANSFTSLLKNSSTNITANFFAWNPKQLLNYQKIATKLGWQIVWLKNYAQLLKAIYPFEEFLTAPTNANFIQQTNDKADFLDLDWQSAIPKLTAQQIEEFHSYFFKLN